MASIKFNADEQRILQELTVQGHIFAVLMYFLEFRRRMDFATFTVGGTKESTVSEQHLADCVECNPARGSHYKPKKHNRDFVQRQIKTLVSAGLLQRLKKRHRLDPMRFYFPVAAGTASVCAQEERTMSAQGAAHYADNNQAPNFSGVEAGFAVDNSTAEHKEKTGRSALIPVLPVYKQNQDIFDRPVLHVNPDFQDCGILPNDVCDTTIPADWEPDENLVKALSAKHRVPADFVRWRTCMFRFYVSDSGTRSDNWPLYYSRWFTKGAYEHRQVFLDDLRLFEANAAKKIAG
ncbi:hypothetical protein [Teredinibacter turnerae]|uniref:hypothetical protein n=1 Tax=Teredinibacter turnerae TaxID=2426 RepID=UPI0030CCFC4C